MIKSLHVLLFLTLALSACSYFDEDVQQKKLPGERLSVMQLQKSLEVEPNDRATEPMALPSPWKNAFWPQAGGYPNHAMQHIALPDKKLKQVWNADIGDGAKKRFPLNATPIAVDGRVFTMDTDHRVVAFSMGSGEKLWDTDVKNQFEEDRVMSGGLAFGDNILIVTNGYNEVIGLNYKTGSIIWRKSIPAPSHAAPTVLNGRVYITTIDNRLIALSSKDGSPLWEYTGIGEMAALVGSASPAAGQNIVVPAFSSGEISALRVENGSVAWTNNLSLRQRYGGLNNVSDIKAHPVLDNGQIFAISFGGRLVAIDQRTGARQWQRDIGGATTPWVVGNTVFVLSSENELVAINRKNGLLYWVKQLDMFGDKKDKEDPITWYDPIFAGGRLIIVSNIGLVVEISAADGSQVRRWRMDHAVARPAIVTDEMMMVLSPKGRLYTYK